MSQRPSLYELLGVADNASAEVIRRAWRQKILVYHPDKRSATDSDERHMFHDIQRAYETLSNRKTRLMYDETSRADNDDEKDISSLPTNMRPSQEFEIRIQRWTDEYPTRTFIDNVEKEFSDMMTALADKYKDRLRQDPVRQRCHVCHESFRDLTAHQEDKKRILNEFVAQYNESTLDEYLALTFPVQWNWKPIAKPPAIIQELWLSQKWDEFKSLIDSLAAPIAILQDGTVKTSFAIDESVQSIVNCILNVPSIEFLPNIARLTGLIDYEHRRREPPFFRRWTNGKDYEERVSGTLCIVHRTDNVQVLEALKFQIQAPPISVDKMDCTSCDVCQARFNMLRSKHRCRMCGKIQCDDCQVWQSCRHLGFVQPVRICRPCSQRRHTLLCKVLHEKIERLIMEPYSDCIHLYLALLHYYDRDRTYDEIYRRTCRYFWYKKEFSPVLQCYRYFAIDQEWIQLAEQLCNEHSALDFAAISLASVSSRSSTFWINKANNYFEQNQPTLALLCYQQTNLTIDTIWLALTSTTHDQARLYLSYYIQCKVERMSDGEKSKWIYQLRQHLLDEKFRLVAIRQLQLFGLSAVEWMTIVEELTDKQEYVVAAEILRTLHPYSQEYTHPFLQSVSTFLRSSTIEVDIWLNGIVGVDQMIMNMAFLYHLLAPLNWEDLQTACLKEKKLIAAILCHKVRASLYPDLHISTEWIEKAILNDEPIAYELKRLITGKTWQQLAEECLETDRLHVAMHYTYLRLQCTHLLRPTVQSVLKFTEAFFSAEEILRFILATYKKVQHDPSCCVLTIEFLLKYCLSSETRVNVIARTASTKQMSKYLISLYTWLLDELRTDEEFFESYDACLHRIAHTEKVQNLLEQHPAQIQAFVTKQLRSVVHRPISVLTSVLAKINNSDIVEQILSECFDQRTVANGSDEFRAKMWLLTGIRDQLQNQYVNAVGSFHKAMSCYCSNETGAAILRLLKDPQFTAALLAELVASLNEINVEILAGFGCDIEPPPTTFMEDNCLRPSANSTFIRRYEQAILEQRSEPSIRTALSYIDMCCAVHDPTIIVSNLLLAGVHFYNLLLRHRRSGALVYAYRQSIERLCYEAFYYTICYLSPPMQIHAYRLMITLLCRATSILRTVSCLTAGDRIIQEEILSNRCARLVRQLFDRTIHLSEVSPLMNMPVSLSFDVQYLEFVSQSFLIEYLDAMSTKNTVPSMSHQYYILEGVWLGWIRDRTLADTRHAAMEVLLHSKQWNMFDIQALFQLSIVPRTSDGWLYRERMPLLLTTGEFCFQQAEGISVDMQTGQVQFLFRPALASDDGLFDDKDVAEVFQNGLTDTFFSLDQPEGDFHYHPFQQMRYKPYTLFNTRYLATMLHVDYLLKMFTSGLEISTKVPFHGRPIAEGFFQRLPEHLRQKLRPLHESSHIRGNQRRISHRFWIQPQDATFETRSARDGNDTLVMRVGDIRLRVRKRRLVHNEKGMPIDDDEENLDEQQSPESQFARAFTEHYDEIGTYFPEFLRLKELIKLGLLLMFTRTAYQILKQPVSVHSLSESLAKWRENIEYPHATYANQLSKYNDCLAHNWLTADEVSVGEAARVQNEIRAYLEDIDHRMVEQWTNDICELCHSYDKYTARRHVERWLERKQNDPLAKFMADSLNNHNQARLKHIEQMHIKFDDGDNVRSISDSTSQFCNWIPAVYHLTNSNVRVYGGLQLSLDIHLGVVPPSTGIRQYNALTVLRSASATEKHPAQQVQQVKKSDKVSPAPPSRSPTRRFNPVSSKHTSSWKPYRDYSDSKQYEHQEIANTHTGSMKSDSSLRNAAESPTQQVAETQEQPQTAFSPKTSSSVSNFDSTEMWMDCDSPQLFQCLKKWFENYEPEGITDCSPLIHDIKRKYCAQVIDVPNKDGKVRSMHMHPSTSTSLQRSELKKEDTFMARNTASSTSSSTSATVPDGIRSLRQTNDRWLREYKKQWLQDHGVEELVEQLPVLQDTNDEFDDPNKHSKS